MYLNLQNLVAAAAVLTAALTLLGSYNRAYEFIRRQRKQDEAITAIKAEQRLLIGGVLACLKGLKEQGCNGPVTEAIATIEQHLNDKAHV